MLAQQIAAKYGRALFELARERNLIDVAWDQFKALSVYLGKDATLMDFMSAPQIPDAQKNELMTRVFGERVTHPFFEFLLVLVDKHRMNFLPEIITEFDRLVRIERGIAKAVCITTSPITPQEREKLIDRLARKSGLKIELEERVDESIIGGMIVIFQDQIIDGSIRYALSLLRNRLMKTKVH
jgi:F-type H+-transporting ATPase subunit delta